MADKDSNMALRRWTRITCRSIHLCSMAVVVGALMFGGRGAVLEVAMVGLLLSGLGMMAMDMLGKQPYLREVRGVSVYIKVALLAAAWYLPAARIPLLFVVIVLSGYVSHMPAKQRYFVVFGPKSDGAK